MPRTARKTKTVDVLGIGFGPSNIALAIALEERSSPLDVHFIEAASGPCWQPQMLISGSDIQNNPLRDLVTPRNPCTATAKVTALMEVLSLIATWRILDITKDVVAVLLR